MFPQEALPGHAKETEVEAVEARKDRGSTQVLPASVKRFSQLVHLPHMGRASMKSLGTKHMLVQKHSETA